MLIVIDNDDAIWVYIHELNTTVVGDFTSGFRFPNVSNPWKPTRFALDRIKELERIRALKLEYIFFSGGGYLFKGEQQKEL
jgi:hypothetical protein